MKKFLYLFVGVLVILTSCNNDDDDDVNVNPINPTNTDVTVQDFMWKAMNLWYFWQAEVPDLADSRFSTGQEYTDFLAATPNLEDFYKSIQFNEDRFSFSNEDYTTLVNNLNGISKSNGMEFGLSRFGEGNDVFGYVQYVIPGSDSEEKGIKRGDIFTEINGQQLFQDRNDRTNNNYNLFNNDTYTLTIAEIVDNTISNTDEEITLTKEENLVENPIFIATTFNVDGKTVAYLMYNGFRSNFNVQLNDAFGDFVTAGATELVLDMRYNSGGSVESSRLLSSMIYGTNTGDLYIRQRWNPKIQAAFGNENLEDYFASSFKENPDDQNSIPINTLNLNKVYVLATGSSASASELVMNGLVPYVDVIHIGTTTRGKNEFSLTMVDDPNRSGAPFIYTPDREANINPNNSWAIQPLCGRNENSEGFSDYTSGLVPDIVLEEDLANLGILGDVNEPLLARAIQEISGTTSKIDFSVQMPARVLTDSKMFTPTKDNMYLDKPLNLKLK